MGTLGFVVSAPAPPRRVPPSTSRAFHAQCAPYTHTNCTCTEIADSTVPQANDEGPEQRVGGSLNPGPLI